MENRKKSNVSKHRRAKNIQRTFSTSHGPKIIKRRVLSKRCDMFFENNTFFMKKFICFGKLILYSRYQLVKIHRKSFNATIFFELFRRKFKKILSQRISKFISLTTFSILRSNSHAQNKRTIMNLRIG